MSEYHIKKIGSADFDVLIPLMKDCFGMEVDLQYFQWKYLDNPAGSFIGFIAIDTISGEVGAYYGVIPQKLVMDEKERVVYQSCDTMTHSNHRRKGLFKMLAMECYEYLRKNNELFIIGFGGADSTPGFIKFGWKHVFNFRYCFRSSFLCKLSSLRSFTKGDFSEIASLENLEQLTSQLTVVNAIHSNRSAEHILWRTKNNHFNYQFVFYKQQDKVMGYAVYYINDNKLILFDFIFLNPKSQKALIWFLSKLVTTKGYKAIIAYCQEKGTREKQLRSSLFISNPFKKGPLSERTPFIFFSDEANLKKYSQPANWQMTSYDHDAL